MSHETTAGRDSADFRGRVHSLQIESRALAGNSLGDPTLRNLLVYSPPGWTSAEALPVLYLLPPFTGRPHKYFDTHPWSPGAICLYDRAFQQEEVATPARALIAVPDCFTRLGGSQYVNSSATGAYRDHLVEELIPLVDQHFPASAEAKRGVFGKSSGGFGSLHLSMREAGLFQATAALCPDVAFELCFGTEMLACLRGLANYDFEPRKFLDEFFAEPNLSGDRHAILNILAMSACYSPDPQAALGFQLPMELQRGETIEAVWQRWLSFDPLRCIDQEPRSPDNLRALEHLHLECGLRDEYNLQWGLRRFCARLDAAGVPYHHEEHPGGHRGGNDRLVLAINSLASALGD